MGIFAQRDTARACISKPALDIAKQVMEEFPIGAMDTLHRRIVIAMRKSGQHRRSAKVVGTVPAMKFKSMLGRVVEYRGQ